MRNLIGRMFTGLAATALAITTSLAMAAPARAAIDVYTPNDRPISIIGSEVSFTLGEAGQTLTCELLEVPGYAIDPGAIRPLEESTAAGGGFDASGCTNPVAGDVAVDPVGIWEFAITGAEVDSVSPAAFGNVGLFIDIAGCSVNITGEMAGDFNHTSETFTVTGSTLSIVDDPSGYLCSILGVAQGGSVSSDGTWLITGLTITNP